MPRIFKTLADLCAPDREQDEALARVIRGFEESPEPTRADDERVLALTSALEAQGVVIVSEDDPIPTGARLILSVEEVVMLAGAMS